MQHNSRAILTNPDILPTTPLSSIWRNDFWGTAINSSNSHGSYRPLCVLSFRLNYWFSGFKPWSYHTVNIMLHSLSTFLVYVLGKILILPQSICFVASIIFAVHPIHTEAVSSIVGRADLLANIFYTSSFICYIHHVKHRNRWKIKSTANRIIDSRKRTIECCDADYHIKPYRLGFLVQRIFCILKLGTCSSELEGMPNKMIECCGIREWLCLGASILLAGAAMLSKETGLTVMAVCAVYDYIKTKPNQDPKKLRSYKSIIILIFTVLLFLLFRLYIMGNSTPNFSTADNPTSKSKSIITRTLTFAYLPIFNFFLLIYPLYLSFDWGMDAIPRITSIYDPRNILTLAFYTLLFKFTKNLLLQHFNNQFFEKNEKYNNNNNSLCSGKYRRKNINGRICNHTNNFCQKKININNSDIYENFDNLENFVFPINDKRIREGYLISISMLIIPFIPASNLFFYVGFVVAERVLYIPSIGYCFFVAIAYDAFEKRTNFRTLTRILLTVLIMIFCTRTILRNFDWKNDESLYKSGIRINPPKAYANLGSILSSQGRIEEAEHALKIALKFRPNMADAHYNLAILQQGKTEYDEAIKSYKLAIHYRPSLALAYLNLGQLLASRGRCEEAEEVFRKCSKLDEKGLKDVRTHENTIISALMHLGRLQADRGRYKEAVSIYKDAVKSLPDHYPPQILYNLLGEALSHLGEHREAERWHKAAIQAKPDHIPAHLIYGKLLAKNRTRINEAEELFLKAQKIAPMDPAVHQHFGHFLTGIKRYSEAADQFLEAVKLAPNEYGIAINAAIALRQAGLYRQAEQMYRKAVSLKPQDASAHINLGAMLHLNKKYPEAILSYQKALKLSPHDTIALGNLSKLKIVLKHSKP